MSCRPLKGIQLLSDGETEKKCRMESGVAGFEGELTISFMV